jgi:mRNA interferase MazF
LNITTGDIILIPYPFAELVNIKLRPVVVICSTSDSYKDLVVSAISSVIRTGYNDTTIILNPSRLNNLKVTSTVLVDRIFTLKRENMIKMLGRLNDSELHLFIEKFRKLPEIK